MEAYFKLRLILEFIVPLVLIGLVVISATYLLSKNWLKSKLMKKLEYTYDHGLGNNASYEFQPHWLKGKVRINCKEISGLKYSKIRNYVEQKER